jgi:hypothetical protein
VQFHGGAGGFRVVLLDGLEDGPVLLVDDLQVAGLLSVLVLPNYGFDKAFACLGRTIKTLKW